MRKLDEDAITAIVWVIGFLIIFWLVCNGKIL